VRTLPAAAATVLALAFLGGAAAGAAAQAPTDPCEDSLLRCGYEGTSPVLAPAQARSLTVVLPVHDTAEARALYREVLRPPYAMPEKPLVAVQVLEAEFPTRVADDLPTTRFMEGPISLRGRRPGGEEGWFHISEPVLGDYTYSSGRDVGLPKEYAEDMYLRPEGATWHGRAVVAGRPALDLRWSPAPVDPGPLAHRWGRSRDPFFSVLPALAPTGGAAYRTKFTAKPLVPVDDVTFGSPLHGLPGVAPVTRLPEPQPGMVEYHLAPDVDANDDDPRSDPLPQRFPDGTDLSDLVDTDGVAPGYFWDPVQGLVLIQTSRTGDEQRQG
jgi:hypothetical protein